MDIAAPPPWPASEYLLAADAQEDGRSLARLATEAYERTCRVDFRGPGFCLIDLGERASSEALRHFMLALEREMQEVHVARSGRDLAYVSVARFDQQVSTRPHRDGGPDESFLMLGYEPSEVRSRLAMSDYSRGASDMGLTPAEFLERHNPMFGAGGAWLEPYTTPVEGFTNRHAQILLVNNSIASRSEVAPAWQGVLHTATVLNPSDALRRVVNSAMVASVPFGTPEAVTPEQLDEFATTRAVRRRGHDKPHLEDED